MQELVLTAPDGYQWGIRADNGKQLSFYDVQTGHTRLAIVGDGGLYFYGPDGGASGHFRMAGSYFVISRQGPSGNPTLLLEWGAPGHESRWMLEAEGDQLSLRDATVDQDDAPRRLVLATVKSQAAGKPLEIRGSDGITVLMEFRD